MTSTVAAPVHPGGAVRLAVARHPVPAMLLMMFTISFALLIPAALAGLTIEPFLLGAVLFGQLLPAVLVTGAVGGRPAVRELFGRVFRWRVHPRWYLVALLGMPVASLLASAAVFGPGALRALVADPAVIVSYLGAVSIMPLINLWEETALMGVVQARLATTRGSLLGALMTAPFFGLVHLPLHIGKPAGLLVTGVLINMAMGIPFRIVVGWLYNRTGGSILLVAALHATFNATNNTQLLTAAAPNHGELLSNIPWFVVIVWGLLLAVTTRGRLGSDAR